LLIVFVDAESWLFGGTSQRQVQRFQNVFSVAQRFAAMVNVSDGVDHLPAKTQNK
jgi:hypothetical protein